MVNYIVFAVALLSVHSVYGRSYGIVSDIRTYDHQSYNPDVDQPTLIRKTRSVKQNAILDNFYSPSKY